MEYLGKLYKQFPEGLYGMEIAGIEQVFVWDPDLVAEVSKKTRRGSSSRSTRRRWPMSGTTREPALLHRPTSTKRNGAWRTSPAFSQRAMKGWGRCWRSPRTWWGSGSVREQPVNITDDYTRLTLDTIALSGFGYRFDSFAKEDLHPFLNALLQALVESLRRSQELPMMTKMRKADDKKYRENIRLMRDLVESVMERREGATVGRRPAGSDAGGHGPGDRQGAGRRQRP